MSTRSLFALVAILVLGIALSLRCYLDAESRTWAAMRGGAELGEPGGVGGIVPDEAAPESLDTAQVVDPASFALPTGLPDAPGIPAEMPLETSPSTVESPDASPSPCGRTSRADTGRLELERPAAILVRPGKP